MSEIITMKDKRINELLMNFHHTIDETQSLMRKNPPPFNGEHYLSDKEVSESINVSRRTLQEWRNEGKIPFISLGGKMIYKASDIEKMLKSNYYGSINY